MTYISVIIPTQTLAYSKQEENVVYQFVVVVVLTSTSCFSHQSAHWQEKMLNTKTLTAGCRLQYGQVKTLCLCVMQKHFCIIKALKDCPQRFFLIRHILSWTGCLVHHHRGTWARSCRPWNDVQWRSTELYVNYSDCVSLCDNTKDSI